MVVACIIGDRGGIVDECVDVGSVSGGYIGAVMVLVFEIGSGIGRVSTMSPVGNLKPVHESLGPFVFSLLPRTLIGLLALFSLFILFLFMWW